MSKECKFKTQIVMLEDTNVQLFFEKQNLSNMKIFMEGSGFMIQMKKENPYTALQDTCVYITSNELPAVATAEDGKNYNWPALRVRTNFFEAKYSCRDNGVFPLNAPMLAHTFADLLFR